jgi:hypothetical protein
MGYQGQPSRKTQVNVGRTTLKLDEGDDDLIVLVPSPKRHFRRRPGRRERWRSSVHATTQTWEPEVHEKMMSLIASQIARGLNIAEAN